MPVFGEASGTFGSDGYGSTFGDVPASGAVDFDAAIDFDAPVDFDEDLYTLDTGVVIYPTMVVEVAFGSAPFDTTLVWVDISAYCTGSMQITAGRSSELDRVTPGSCRFTISDQTRDFDPTNAAGPYYGQLVPNTPLRVTATYNGTSHRLFYGTIQAWPQSYDLSNRLTTISIDAIDMLGQLARRSFVPAWSFVIQDPTYGLLDSGMLISGGPTPDLPRVFSGVRVLQLLLAAGVPAAMCSVAWGSTILQGGVVTESSLLDHLAKVESTELGKLWCTPAGVITFWSRRQGNTYTQSSQATFTDVAGADYVYQRLELDPADVRLLRNKVTRGNDQVGSFTATDTTSINTYGVAADETSDLLFDDPSDARSQAQYLTGRYASPTPRILSLGIMPQRNPATLFPAVLGFHLGYRVTVQRTPLGTGPTLSQVSTIEQVVHDVNISQRSWSTSWMLSEPDLQPYFQIGHATRGVLDAGLEIAY